MCNARSVYETRLKRDTLRLELASWQQAVRTCMAAYEPWERAAQEANDRLVLLLKTELPGQQRLRALADYDVRWKVYHASHPYKALLQEAELMVKALVAEVRKLNEALDNA